MFRYTPPRIRVRNRLCRHRFAVSAIWQWRRIIWMMTSSLKTVLGQSYWEQFQDRFSGVEIFRYTPPRIRVRNRLCRHRFAVSAIWQWRRIIWMMTSSLKTVLGQSYWAQFQDMFSGVEIFRYTPPRIRIRNRLCRHRFVVSAIWQWRRIIWLMTSSLKTVLVQSYWEQFQDMFSGVEMFRYTPPRIRIRNRLCRHRFVVSAIWQWRRIIWMMTSSLKTVLGQSYWAQFQDMFSGVEIFRYTPPRIRIRNRLCRHRFAVSAIWQWRRIIWMMTSSLKTVLGQSYWEQFQDMFSGVEIFRYTPPRIHIRNRLCRHRFAVSAIWQWRRIIWMMTSSLKTVLSQSYWAQFQDMFSGVEIFRYTPPRIRIRNRLCRHRFVVSAIWQWRRIIWLMTSSLKTVLGQSYWEQFQDMFSGVEMFRYTPPRIRIRNRLCRHRFAVSAIWQWRRIIWMMTSSLKTVLGQSYWAQFQDMFSGVEIFRYTPPRIRIRNRLCRHRFAVSAIWQWRRIIWMMTSSLKTVLGQSYWEQFQDMFSGVEIFRYTPPRIRVRNRLCRHRFAVSAISQWRPIIWIMTSSLKTVLGQSYWAQFQDMFSGAEIFRYTPPPIRIRNRLCRHRFAVSAIWQWRRIIWMMTSSLKTVLGQSYWEQFQDMFSGVEIFPYTPPRIRIRNRLCRHRFVVSAIWQWRQLSG